MARGQTARSLRVGVRHLVSLDPAVGGDPADGDLVALGKMRSQVSIAALARAEGIRPYPLNGSRRVREDRVAAPALLTMLEPEEALVDCEDLRVKDLLVCPKMEAVSMPATG